MGFIDGSYIWPTLRQMPCAAFLQFVNASQKYALTDAGVIGRVRLKWLTNLPELVSMKDSLETIS